MTGPKHSKKARRPDRVNQELRDEMTERLQRRPWPVTPLRSDYNVSLEFFPANTDKGAGNLLRTVGRLEPICPTFVSVTYGAGGTTQDRTLKTIRGITDTTDLDVAGHLTCVGASKQEVHEVMDTYAATGVRRIVALRGDPPEGENDGTRPDGYRTAAELVAGIRDRPDGSTWDISVAAYPDVHPKAESAASDLDNLRAKFDAGADRALTQFFFDNEAFLTFHDNVRAAGIEQPIIPGIMPVTNFERMSGFAGRCGTKIPAWMPGLFEGLDDTPEVQPLIAATVSAEQIRHLAEHGIRDFHIYTMNRADLALAICRIVGISTGDADSAADVAVSPSFAV